MRGLREVDGCWLRKGDSPALSDSTASLTSLPPPAPSLIPHPSLPVPSCPSLLCPLEVLVLVDNCNCEDCIHEIMLCNKIAYSNRLPHKYYYSTQTQILSCKVTKHRTFYLRMLSSNGIPPLNRMASCCATSSARLSRIFT